MNASSDVLGQRRWYYGWSIVAVCILSQAVANGLTYNSLSLFYEDWSTQLNAPKSYLMLAIGLMGTVAAMISPFVGALADKFPARRLFTYGLLGIALFYLAVGSIKAAWQLLALYAVLAPVALCLSTAVVANAVISRWFVRRRGLALGLSAFGIGLAGVVLPPVLNRLLHVVDWRTVWWGGGVLVAVVVTPIVALVMRDRPSEEEGRYYLSGEAAPSGHHGGHGGGPDQMSWREVIRRKNFWLLVGIYLPMLALAGAAVQIIRPYSTMHGISKDASAWLLSLLNGMHVLATLVLGMLSDRFGNRLPFAGLAALMVVGALLLAFGSDLPVVTIGCALVGIGGGVIALLAAAIALEFGAAAMGRAFGMAMFFVPLVTLSPFVISRTQEATGSYAPALIGFAILVALSGLLALLLQERRGVASTRVAARTEPSANPL